MVGGVNAETATAIQNHVRGLVLFNNFGCTMINKLNLETCIDWHSVVAFTHNPRVYFTLWQVSTKHIWGKNYPQRAPTTDQSFNSFFFLFNHLFLFFTFVPITLKRSTEVIQHHFLTYPLPSPLYLHLKWRAKLQTTQQNVNIKTANPGLTMSSLKFEKTWNYFKKQNLPKLQQENLSVANTAQNRLVQD